MKIFVMLAEGFEEIEAITVTDILRRAGVDVSFVALADNKMVKGAHEIKISADKLFAEADFSKCDMIVLPGGLLGMQNLDASKELEKKIFEFNASNKWLAAICASPAIFAHKGILGNKKATIYSGMEEGLNGVKWSNEPVVIDGKIITSKGPGTSIDFALAILEIASGEKTRKEVEEGLLKEARK